MAPAGLLFAPPTLGPTIRVTAFTLTAVSTVVVFIRFYCRIWVVGKLKVYDYLIVPAVLSIWALCVINLLQVHYGAGTTDAARGSNDPVHKNRKQAAGIWFAYQLIYPAVPALVKLSILFFYRSIATNRTFRVLVYVTIALVSASTVGMILTTAFMCPHKPSLAYSEYIFLKRKQYRCLPIRKLYFAQASMSIVTDVIVFTLPLPILVRLRMATHKRVGLLVLFSAGLLVPIAAAFRIQALRLWAVASWEEQRYYLGYVIFWDHVESNTAIICASIPSLQPLFKGLFTKISQYSRGRGPYYYYGDEADTATRVTIGRRVSRRVAPDVALDSPLPTYQASKLKDDNVESGVVLVQEPKIDPEEEVRDRVQMFAPRPPSSQSAQPKSPEQPVDILASG